MKFPRYLWLVVTLVTSASIAQTSALSGTWAAKFNAPNGGPPREAKVVIRENEGTWQIQARTSSNPCVGREMPVSVSKVEADTFEFAMTGSKVLAGCEDFVIQMKRVDERTFEGTWGDGRKVLLVRQ